jgi:LacI family transcriptional regulator
MPTSQQPDDVRFAAAKPNLRDVAAAAGVSVMTVSRALNGKGKVSADTRNRILALARELGYRPSQTARALRTSETKLVGMVSPNLMMPLHIDMTLGAKDALAQEGYRLLFDVDSASAAWESYLSTDGDLLLGSPANSDNPTVPHMDRSRTVTLMNSTHPDLDDCGSDLTQAVLVATQHLIIAGYRAISLLQLARSPASDGYKLAHEHAGLPVNPHLIREVGNDIGSVSRVVEQLLATQPVPDSFLVAGVAATPLTLRVLRRLGFQVPDDFGFVGIESRRSELGDLVYPGMTSIRIPGYEIGAAGARRLIERIRGDTSPPQRLNFPSELVIRQSTPGPERS